MKVETQPNPELARRQKWREVSAEVNGIARRHGFEFDEFGVIWKIERNPLKFLAKLIADSKSDNVAGHNVDNYWFGRNSSRQVDLSSPRIIEITVWDRTKPEDEERIITLMKEVCEALNKDCIVKSFRKITRINCALGASDA